MNGLGIVFGRGVDCVEYLGFVAVSMSVFIYQELVLNEGEEGYQWCRASIDELMLSTSRHNHEVSSFDVLVFTSNSGLADSRGEGQGLVDGMNLSETAVSL